MIDSLYNASVNSEYRGIVMEKFKKTNAMRLLETQKIEYELLTYEVDENDLSGEHIANEIGFPYEQVFKTLVTKGEKNGYAVFCIPACLELDLKKAAAAAGEKRLEMLHVKDLLPTTGYIRGGCSPLGMKKKFPTFIDETCRLYDKITVSAGVRGGVLLLSPDDLVRAAEAVVCEVTY